MAEQQADTSSPRLGDTGNTLKRRGILAAAGAVVAGIIAKQTAEPVRASVTNYVASGGSGTAFDVASGGYSTGVSAIGSNYALYGSTASGYGVFAVTTGSGVSNVAGVYGGSGGAGNYGVQGVGSGSGTGVRGDSDAGIGVQGAIPAFVGLAPPVPNTAANTIGVHGTNQSIGAGGKAMYGLMNAGTATGTIGIYGANVTTAPDSHGIVGVAMVGHGLVGTTNYTPGGSGPPYYAGLVGNATHGAYAGLFFGNVQVAGTLNGHSAIMQQAQVAIAHPDGTHRLTQAVVSPEGWIEDFGEGTLTNGQATIAIDPAFATLVDTGKYHVFLTAHGDYHLYVAEMKPDGFAVRTTSMGGSTPPTGGAPVGVSQVAKAGGANGTFSWKVVAKRKDGQVARLATYRFPKIEPPDLSHLPKA